MGSLNGRIERLEGRIPAPKDEGAEPRRSEIIAELDALAARMRSMSPEELEAYRARPENVAARRALEEEIRRRQEGR
jgi:hypothetical protein